MMILAPSTWLGSEKVSPICGILGWDRVLPKGPVTQDRQRHFGVYEQNHRGDSATSQTYSGETLGRIHSVFHILSPP